MAHIPRVFVDSRLEAGKDINLGDKTSHHLIHVLKLSQGSRLSVFDGAGAEFTASVVATSRRTVTVTLEDSIDSNTESPLQITLALAVLKRDAMFRALAGATELGVTKIVPVVSAYSNVSRAELDKRQKQWQTIIIAAAEQCGRAVIPALLDTCNFEEFVSNDDAEIKLIAHPGAPAHPGSPDKVISATALVGPEGGFSTAEVDQALVSGFLLTGLGPRILRAETVPCVLLGQLQLRWGDLSGEMVLGKS